MCERKNVGKAEFPNSPQMDWLSLPSPWALSGGCCRDPFAWQHKGPLLEPLPSISPGFPFKGAFLATVAQFFLCCSLGADRNLVFSVRLQHRVRVSVRIKLLEDTGSSDFKELLKKSCVGATVVVYKNIVIGVLGLLAFYLSCMTRRKWYH